MNKKITIIIILIAVAILIASPAFAKEDVKVKITSQDSLINNHGYIIIKLVTKDGREIRSDGMVNYTIYDENGNYKWVYKEYGSGIRVRYDVGHYKVNVKFFGDAVYSSAKKTKSIDVEKGEFDPYTYYDNHNWGLNQEIDDYIEYNYWDEEIYDDASNYDGEGY